MSDKAYDLISSKSYSKPDNVGEFCVLSTEATTDSLQQNEQIEWESKRTRCVTFKHIRIALIRILEATMDVAYHADNTGMAG